MIDQEDSKEKYKSNIEDYIIILDNIIPDDLCDRILLEYKNSDEWFLAPIADYSTDAKLRDVHLIPISDPNRIARNEILRRTLDNQIFTCSENASMKYSELFPEVLFNGDTGYELLRYKVGQYYVQHTDSYSKHPRTVSCSFALNDDYEGGEFAFFDRKIKYKLKKGSAILFPSNFMFPHEILCVTKGTRYSIITWFTN
jgi:hypothetical protein